MSSGRSLPVIDARKSLEDTLSGVIS
jgi:hypothetical protein